MLQRLLRLICLGCLLTTIACGSGKSANTPAPAATFTADVASPTAPSRTAQLSEINNDVSARSLESADWQTAAEGEALAVGGGARTGDESRARIDISDGTILRLAPNSEFTLVEFSPAETDPVTKLILETGQVFVWVTKALGGGSFEVETPSGNATVRGSLMSANYDPTTGRFAITCLEGQCRLAVGDVITDLVEGQKTEIPGLGQSPLAARLMDRADLDDWAANFPGLERIINRIRQNLPPEPSPTPTAVVSAAQTVCDHPYFPLRAGATWTYTDNLGETTMWTVSNVSGDAESATAEMAWESGTISGRYHWECNAEGLHTYDFGMVVLAAGGFTPSDVTSASGVFLPSVDLLTVGYTWNDAFQFQANLSEQGAAFNIPVAVERAFTLTGMAPVVFNGQTHDGLQVTEDLIQAMTFQTAAPGAGPGQITQTQTATYEIELARGLGFTRMTSTMDGGTVTTVLTAYTIP